MGYTLGGAARATGKSKATISRAIKSGRLSAMRAGSEGYVIDPAELQRVYPATDDTTVSVKRSDTPVAPSPETVALQRLIEEQAETIRDLRQRLDAEAAERRRLSERMAGLLAHRAAGSVPVAPAPTVAPVARGWWRRLFG